MLRITSFSLNLHLILLFRGILIFSFLSNSKSFDFKAVAHYRRLPSLFSYKSVEDVKYIHKIIVNDKNPLKLLEFLVFSLPQVKKLQIKRWLNFKLVTVNNEIQSQFDLILQPGDWVGILAAKSNTNKNLEILKSDSYVNIIFEDDYLLVVDKAAGRFTTLSHSSKHKTDDVDPTKTCFANVNQYLSKRNGKKERVYLVHNLENEISGILLFAKSDEVKKLMTSYWHNAGKSFIALCEGVPSNKIGSFSTVLSPERFDTRYGNVTNSLNSSISKKVSTSRVNDVKTSKDRKQDVLPPRIARLNYRILEQTSTSTQSTSSHTNTSISKEGSTTTISKPSQTTYSLLEISLDSTSENELRRQLSIEGLPIIGDTKHSAHTNPLRRLGLHFSELRIIHPITKDWITINSPTPMSFTRYFEQLARKGQNDMDYNNKNKINASPNKASKTSDELNSIKVISLAEYLGQK